jgi:enoyl-CoA hydratase/3-hydroxyacyl-CoA dehydrogenase
MGISEIKKVCFVGAGTMGCYNSLLAGIAGYEAVVYDISQEALKGVANGQEQLGDFLTTMGIFDKESVTRGRRRVRLEADPKEAVKNADLLSESVFEKLDLKRQIHRQFDGLCPPKTILTTNTSTYMASEIEGVVRRGDRFAAMHFHLGTLLVDVVAGPRTSAETMDIITRFVSSMSCVPFMSARENRGYVFNNLSTGLNCAAAALVAKYHEHFEDIDRAWVTFHNAFIGPFAIMDWIGLNVYYDSFLDMLRHDGDDRSSQLVIDLLQPYMDRGELGIKTGKGFYSYPDPAYGKAEFQADVEARQDIYTVLANAIIIRAVQLVVEGIAEVVDIDKVWMINMQLNSGPFGWLDQKGIDVFLAEIESETRDVLFSKYDRDLVRSYLDPYIKKGHTGTHSGKGFYTYPNPTYESADFLVNPFSSPIVSIKMA